MFKASGTKVKSELLDNLVIAAPCSVSWDSMTGDDRSRACGSCSRSVYNISDMSRSEAEAFLQQNGVKECVTFYRRQDGTIMTDDCPVGLRKLRDRCKMAMRLVATAAAFFISPLGVFAKDSTTSSKPPQAAAPNQMAGGMAVPDFFETQPSKTANPQMLRGEPMMTPQPLGGKPSNTALSPPRLVLTKGDAAINNKNDPSATGKDPYYKLRAEFNDLADPTAYNLYVAGQKNFNEGRILVARAYFKAALKAFNPTNHDWKLQQIVEQALTKAEAAQTTNLDSEDDAETIKIQFDGAKPKLIYTR